MNFAKPIASEAFTISFLLQRAIKNDSQGLTPLQVNKLAYILHGWTLGLLDRPLFDNSPKQVQAWRYGPVVVGIYYTLKPFGNNLVTLDKIKTRYQFNKDDPSRYDEVLSVNVDAFMQENKKTTRHLEWIYEIYAGFGGGALIDLTHEPGGPWDQCRARGLETLGFHGENHIPDSVIGPYYKNFINSHLYS